MTYRGKVQGGVVILQDEAALAEGTEVTVTHCGESGSGHPAGATGSVGQRMIQLAKWAEARPCALPPDLAANHDHYLHGLPRRK